MTHDTEDVPVRIRDIAAALGISPATVSNALAGKRGVSPATIARVREAAERMGYAPAEREKKQAIRSVRLIIAKKHGLVLMDTQFFAELLQGIEAACRARRLELVISRIDIAEVAQSPKALDALMGEEGQAALVLATELSDEDIALFRACGRPFLALDHSFPDQDISCVLMDNRRAGRLAATALMDAGHTRIEVITSSVTLHNMDERVEGFQQALASRGLGQAAVLRVTPTIDGAHAEVAQHMRVRKDMPTAIFACNDIIAVGAMKALTAMSLRIPEDISIIGMDGLDLSIVTTPPLTTIHVYRERIAACAVDRLLALCRAGEGFGVQKTTVGVELLPRGSIAPPR